MSKIIQIIRFLNIGYSSELKIALLTWGTSLLSFDIPDQLDQQIASRDIPPIFTIHRVEASFLANFWQPLLIIVTAFSVWIACQVFLRCFKPHTNSQASLKYILIRKFSVAACNFLVAIIYGGFGDVIFFSVLEMQSFTFKSSSSCASFALSVIFILIGLWFFVMHWRFLIIYRRLRAQESADAVQALNELKVKYKWMLVLHSDFSDQSLFRHSFLFVLVVRDTVISLIVTTMVAFPLAQSIILYCSSILMCVYLLCASPYQHRFERMSLLFQELSALIIFICVLTFAVLDNEGKLAAGDRERLGKAILTVNIIFNSVSSLLMLIKILQMGQSGYTDFSHWRKNRVFVQMTNTSRIGETSQTKLNNQDYSMNASIHEQKSSTLVPKNTIQSDLQGLNKGQEIRAGQEIILMDPKSFQIATKAAEISRTYPARLTSEPVQKVQPVINMDSVTDKQKMDSLINHETGFPHHKQAQGYKIENGQQTHLTNESNGPTFRKTEARDDTIVQEQSMPNPNVHIALIFFTRQKATR